NNYNRNHIPVTWTDFTNTRLQRNPPPPPFHDRTLSEQTAAADVTTERVNQNRNSFRLYAYPHCQEQLSLKHCCNKRCKAPIIHSSATCFTLALTDG
ncbi:hypothetical protein COCMIDRAFT_87502, partial [Bipolaris oryzae ATCC 44560]